MRRDRSIFGFIMHCIRFFGSILLILAGLGFMVMSPLPSGLWEFRSTVRWVGFIMLIIGLVIQQMFPTPHRRS